MPPINHASRHKLMTIMGLVVVVLAYWPALSGGFIFDDYPIFAENPNIHVTGWSWAEWHHVWAWAEGNIHRPLAMLTYALNYALGGSPFGFKLTNLVIHVFNTWLVWLLAHRILTAAWSDDSSTRTRSISYWALAVALAWAIHPLQVSAVMYVVQRMELMSFTFTLLALLTWWHGRQQQLDGRAGWPWFVLCGAIGIVGWGAKETIVLVPGYMLLLELTVLHFAAGRKRTARLWRWLYAAGCVLALLVTVFYVFPHYATPGAYAGRNFTAWERELTQLRALPMYLYWSVMPLPSHLVFYYDDYVASTSLLHPLSTLFGGLLLLALLAVAFVMRRRRPVLALGISWFFVAHALTSAPIGLELVFEHRNYPALLGVVLALADIVYWAACKSRSRVPLLAAGAVMLACLSLTVVRAATWGSPLLLATTLASNNPDSARAAQDLARRYMAMSGGNAASPLYSLAIQELERGATLPGSSPLAEQALLLEAAKNPDLGPTQPWWDSFFHKLRTKALIPDTYAALHRLMTVRTDGHPGIDAHQLAKAYAIAVQRNPRRASMRAEYAELLGATLHDENAAAAQWRKTLEHVKKVDDYAPRLLAHLLDENREREAEAVVATADTLMPSLRHDPAWVALSARAGTTTHSKQATPARLGESEQKP